MPLVPFGAKPSIDSRDLFLYNGNTVNYHIHQKKNTN